MEDRSVTTQAYLDTALNQFQPPSIAMAGGVVTAVSQKKAEAKEALEPFLDKEYRDEYLDAYVKSTIAQQIRFLREKAGLTQVDFAKGLGTTQSTVSRIEDAEYGSVTVATLLKVAKQNNVAVEIIFTDYPTMLSRNVSAHSLRVNTIFESYATVSQATETVFPPTPASANTINNPVVLIGLSFGASTPTSINQSRGIQWQIR